MSLHHYVHHANGYTPIHIFLNKYFWWLICKQLQNNCTSKIFAGYPFSMKERKLHSLPLLSPFTQIHVKWIYNECLKMNTLYSKNKVYRFCKLSKRTKVVVSPTLNNPLPRYSSMCQLILPASVPLSEVKTEHYYKFFYGNPMSTVSFKSSQNHREK